MLKLKMLLLLLLFGSSYVSAQQSSLTIKLANAKGNEITVVQSRKALNQDFLGLAYETISLKEKKEITKKFNFKTPEFVSLSYDDDANKKHFNYDLYISPGDQLIFTADLNQKDNAIIVTGKGSKQCQPLLQKIENINYTTFYKDTLPNRMISAMNKQQAINEKVLTNYVKTFQPSASFVKDFKLKVKYIAIESYFHFKENNKYEIRKAYERNMSSWKKVQDSLFNEAMINDDNAINIPEYLHFVGNYMSRKKESLWEESSKNPDQFFKKWYGDAEKGKKAFSADMQNDLQEKIINTYFSGKTAEYLYSVLIEEAIEESVIQNLIPIFGRFKQKYPKNEFAPLFQPYITGIEKRMQQKLNSQMIFAKDNGINLKTFDEVLAMFKGKTVLLDMWGTWCGPCREEIEKNGKEIKKHFLGKGLDYLYISNYDTTNEEKWKQLIPYFELTGNHILASQELTKDIMNKIKGTGYPTYLVIKKDGTFELSKAGFPMERQLIIKQLEEALSLPSGK